ncbi:SEC-C metal-binding domain-containing protein [Pseudomonas frederiksbergensis]
MDNLFLVRGEHNVSRRHHYLQLWANRFFQSLAYYAIFPREHSLGPTSGERDCMCSVLKTFERSMQPRIFGRNEPCPCGSGKSTKNAVCPEDRSRRIV